MDGDGDTATRGCACEPVGVKEIAERLGVKRNTADEWRTRRRAQAVGFPPPRWEVGGRPAWDWADVKAWAASTGRLPGPA